MIYTVDLLTLILLDFADIRHHTEIAFVKVNLWSNALVEIHFFYLNFFF